MNPFFDKIWQHFLPAKSKLIKPYIQHTCTFVGSIKVVISWFKSWDLILQISKADSDFLWYFRFHLGSLQSSGFKIWIEPTRNFYTFEAMYRKGIPRPWNRIILFRLQTIKIQETDKSIVLDRAKQNLFWLSFAGEPVIK